MIFYDFLLRFCKTLAKKQESNIENKRLGNYYNIARDYINL